MVMAGEIKLLEFFLNEYIGKGAIKWKAWN